MSNLKFKNALSGKAQNCPPVWMMRQAGRYHGHYQALRKEHSFVDLCKKPKLAAETALGPIEDFDFDVSILFSDLLFPLEAIGLGLTYDPGPKMGWHLSEVSDFKKLRNVDQAIEDLQFQKSAVEETRKVLPSSKSFIGFVGSPWTLFVYAVGGSHKGTLTSVKSRLSLFAPFCELMVPLLKKNIALQLSGGVESVMLFDTAAGELAPADFHQMVEPHINELLEAFPGKLGYYSKHTQESHIKNLASHSSLAGMGYDHRWDLISRFGKTNGFVQGNFDQTLLFCKPDEFKLRFENYLKPFLALKPEERVGWVCGLGHGVLPETPNENVRHFVKYTREVFS